MSLPRISVETLIDQEVRKIQSQSPTEANTVNWILPAVIGLAVVVAGILIIQHQNQAILRGIADRMEKRGGDR
jgi:hypothetical protein